MRRAVIWLGLLSALTLSAACSRGDASPPDPTVREDTTTTSTTTLEDSYAVPDVIDAAYVNRVLAALDEVYGDVTRRVVETRRFEPDDLVPLRAIFNDPLLGAQAKGFALLTGDDPERFHSPPGNRVTQVLGVITGAPECLYVEAAIDISRVVRVPPPPRKTFVELRPTQAGADPANLNPTPWSIANEGEAREPRCA